MFPSKLAKGVLLLALFAGTAVMAEGNGPRQYYGGWSYHPTSRYHYRAYYYRPTSTYGGYRHHYAIYYPTGPRSRYVYFYNPYRRTYWGRCPTASQAGRSTCTTTSSARRGQLRPSAGRSQPPSHAS